MAATLLRRDDGALIRKAGVMAVVLTGGVIRGGDRIALETVPEIKLPLAPI
jgi:MOSC domain-containing protein YiiM